MIMNLTVCRRDEWNRIEFDHKKNCLVFKHVHSEARLPKTENFDLKTHSLYQLSPRDIYMTKIEGDKIVHQ